MKKPVARFIFRSEDGKANLIIGTCFKDQEFFKGNEVWQIEEVMGELMLKKVGESVVGPAGYHQESEIMGCNWNHAVGDILSYGKYIFLTREEYQVQVEKEEKELRENEKKLGLGQK